MYTMGLFLTLLILASYANAEASSEGSAIGIVDFTYLVEQYPATAGANLELKKEHEVLQQEFMEKSKALSDEDKIKLDHEVGMTFEKKRQELFKEVADNVLKIVQKTAKQKGIDVIFDKKGWICGGTDLTQDVLKNFSK